MGIREYTKRKFYVIHLMSAWSKYKTQVSRGTERSSHVWITTVFEWHADADALLLRIKANESELSPRIVVELVETVKESVPECEFIGTQRLKEREIKFTPVFQVTTNEHT